MAKEVDIHTVGALVLAFLLLSFVTFASFREHIHRYLFADSLKGTVLVSTGSELRLLSSRHRVDISQTGHVTPAHTPFFFMPVPVNKASAELLSTLPGVGPKTAARIIEYRNKEGRVQGIDHLLLIKGIGPEKLALIKPHITTQ